MKFGTVPVSEAEGTLLAHSLHIKKTVLKKGRKLSAADVAAIAAAGVSAVMVAQLGPDDVAEDPAAAQIAAAVAGGNADVAAPFTGRANIYAKASGVLVYDQAKLLALNAIDESLTLAALPSFARVEPGEMLATIKVIPFAMPRRVLEQAKALLADAPPLIAVQAFQVKRAGLVLTRFPSTKPSILDKRIKAIRDRIVALGGTLAVPLIVGHQSDAIAVAVQTLSKAGLDPILVFGASAIVDRGDVIPSAITALGGKVIHLGMPVDPGNLLLVGRLGEATVIGVPSCASSPKVNGFDWVLERHAAGLAVGRREIIAMGGGGLLKEIPSRPVPRDQPRDRTPTREANRIGALVLAAGRSSRMGERNKLLELADHRPIIARVVDQVLASRARPVVVVTGHRRVEIERALAGRDVTFVHNPDYAEGLATSLAAGIAALPGETAGTLVILGDMPDIGTPLLESLIAAFEPADGRAIAVPARAGRRGNPVLWGRAFFESLQAIRGDTGARHLIGENEAEVVEIEVEGDAIFTDVDTPEALAAWRRGFTPT